MVLKEVLEYISFGIIGQGKYSYFTIALRARPSTMSEFLQ